MGPTATDHPQKKRLSSFVGTKISFIFRLFALAQLFLKQADDIAARFFKRTPAPPFFAMNSMPAFSRDTTSFCRSQLCHLGDFENLSDNDHEAAVRAIDRIGRYERRAVSKRKRALKKSPSD